MSKEINWAEHEYMNIAPPPSNYRSSGAPELASRYICFKYLNRVKRVIFSSQ